jgi:hypothetical protein
MQKVKLSKPKFLTLDQEAKQKIIANISNTNLEDNDKNLTKESMLFIDELEKKIKTQSITSFQQIKNLFEVYSKKIQATQ